MTRAQLLAWYEAIPLPKDGNRLYATVDGDRLILGLFKDGARRGLYIMYPDGRHVSAVQSRQYGPAEYSPEYTWGERGFASVLSGGDMCWSWRGERLLVDEPDLEIVWTYLKEVRHETNVPFRMGDIMRDITFSDAQYDSEKREDRERRKRERINSLMDQIQALPDGFEDFCHTVVFGGRHYAFGKGGSSTVFCTACGQRHKVSWRERSVQTCPHTGATVTVIKRMDSVYATELVTVPFRLPSADNHWGAVAVIVTAEVSCHWGQNEAMPEKIFFVDARQAVPVPKRGKADTSFYYIHDEWHGNSYWTDRNRGLFITKKGYLWPDVSALAGTWYDTPTVRAAAMTGWRMNDHNLLMLADQPWLEYIIKGRFLTLTQELTDSPNLCRTAYLGIDPDGTSAAGVLGLDGQQVARLRQDDGGLAELAWLRAQNKEGFALPSAVLAELIRWKICPSDTKSVRKHLSPEQIVHYVKKQAPQYDGMTIRNVEHMLRQWVDTADMAIKLGLPADRDSVWRPKCLKARHDELAMIIAEKADELETQRIEAEYPGCKAGCDAVRELFAWSDGAHTVAVPSGAADIKREGKLLSHCVGSTDRYFDRIACGESYILFLRRANEPDKPWYTMEVEPGGRIRQLRTYGDNEGEERQEAKTCLRAWQKVVRSRLTEEQRRQAETATERYLRELDELMASGSRIRGGRMAGQMLGKVLADDYMDLNMPDQDEEQKEGMVG